MADTAESLLAEIRGSSSQDTAESLLAEIRGGSNTPLASSLQEIGAAPEFNEFSKRAFQAAIAANLITDEQELGQALQQHFPEAKVINDAEGNAIIDLPSGQFALNKPGLSGQDFAKFITRALLFTPAGRGLQGIGAGTLAKSAGTAGATEAALQGVEQAVGGEADASEVGIAAGLAPVAQVVGETVLSPLARVVGGKVSDSTKKLIQEANKKDIDILTTDVIPPEGFAGKTLQHLGEKLGPIGTGSKRIAQQRARTDVVEGLAQELGVSLDTPVEREIFKSLKSGVAKQLNRAAIIRNEAVDSLDTFGNVPVDKTLKAIDTQIAKQKRLKTDADPAIINRLESLKQSITDSDFSLVKDLRSNLIDDINAAFKGESLPTKASAPLQAVKSSIDDDLLTFAKKHDRTAASKWIRSNRVFSDGYRKAKETELRRLLKKGDATPEFVSTVIKSGRPSELKRLDSLLDEKGRASARVAILKDVLSESGYFRKGPNPNSFSTALNRDNRQKAINVFFKGKEKDQIEGIRRVLEVTRRAQDAPVSTTTGQQLFAPVAAIAGAQVDLGASFGIAATLGGVTRAYESAGVRNLLLRLASAKKGSAAERKILDQLIPFFQGAAQAGRSQATEQE